MTKNSAAVNEVIAELKSEYGDMGRAVGPIKNIDDLELTSVTADIVTRAVRGAIAVRAYHETPYGDKFRGEEAFEVTLADAQKLAQIAPKFRPCFAEVAERMMAHLENEQAADRQAIAGWCDEGLPTGSATTIMKPLRWKFGPG